MPLTNEQIAKSTEWMHKAARFIGSLSDEEQVILLREIARMQREAADEVIKDKGLKKET